MKGLLIKDLAILKQQSRSLIAIVLIAVFMMMAEKNVNFVISYVNILFVMFGITTLNYDAFDNGFTFLFTLPITKKMYVAEKYLFSLMCVATGIILSVVFIFAVGQMSSEAVGFLVGYVWFAVIFLSLLLPIELKFGPEKGRVAMIVLFAIIMSLAFVVKKLAGEMDFTKLVYFLETSSKGVLIAIGCVTVVAIMVISYLISCRIMEKKEF